jgi:hypothetical protein
MTGKKKVGILATLALCVTVGGVYATWNYTQGTAVETHATITTKLASAEISTEAIGSLKVVAVGGIKIDDANNDYVADVTFDGDTYFTVNLENPADGVDLNKVQLQYTITLEGVPSEDGSDRSILTYNMGAMDYSWWNPATKEVETGHLDAVDNIITKSEFGTRIELDLKRFVWSQDLKLETKADYDAYETAFRAATRVFKVTVTDVTQY